MPDEVADVKLGVMLPQAFPATERDNHPGEATGVLRPTRRRPWTKPEKQREMHSRLLSVFRLSCLDEERL